MLKLKELKIQRGSFQIGPLNLELAESELKLLLGRNGAGKTSIFLCVLNRLKPESGLLSGNDVPIGCSGVEPVLVESWTVEQNFRFYHWLANRQFDRAITDHIQKFWGQRVSELSSGKRRQVELCIVLSHQFDINLLDEPFNHLDSVQRQHFAKVLDDLKAKGCSFLVSAHAIEDLAINYDGVIEI